MSGKCDEPSKDPTTITSRPDLEKVEGKDVAKCAAMCQPVDAEDTSFLHNKTCLPTSTSLEKAATGKAQGRVLDARRIRLARMEE